ncbi:hypothetical protein [uncultured Dialister sp.]|uniref:hypothetical protein n=1 Tax=Dialister hominis TaxID=2582419 RepID=UPI00266E9D74|nr:hypothetical protein [uncultured Dialister sp.]
MKNGKVFLRLSVIALLLACTSGTIVQAEDVSGKVNEVSESAEDTVYGGNAADGSALNNQLSITKEASVNGSAYSGYSSNREASGNTLKITRTGTIYESAEGGYVNYGSGAVSGNKVFMESGEVLQSINSGSTGGSGDATGNSIELSGGTVTISVYGGVSAGDNAKGNSVTIGGGSIDAKAGNVYGGVTLTSESVESSGNYLYIKESGTVDANAYGGYSGFGSALKNIVTMTGGTVGDCLYGGRVSEKSNGEAFYNEVTISGGTVSNDVIGGYSQNGDVIGNKVTVEGTATVKGTDYSDVYGGYSIDGKASGNQVQMTGGSADSGTASNNTVNIYGGTFKSDTRLYGGFSDDSSGNTLNFYTKGITVDKLGYFQNLSFYVPEDTTAGETILTVTSTADVSGASIRASVYDSMKMSPGDTITLIDGRSGLTAEDTDYGMMSGSSTVTDAAFLRREVNIRKDGDKVILEVPEDSVPSLLSDTKLLAEAREASIETLWNASDMAAENYKEAVDAYAAGSGGFMPYASIGGFDLRHETGSYIDTAGLNANIGFARQYEREDYVDTLMPFFEYGRSNYTSHLDDGARADGDQHYTRAGVLYRRDRKDGLHYEALVRAGHLSGDFKGKIDGYDASYDSGAPYIAAMAGLGKVVTRDTNALDYYGKFFWTHLGSDNVRIDNTLGSSRYDFDSIDSYRTRLGVRWTKDISDIGSCYAGIGWDYEFDSKARASYRSFNTPSPSAEGSSGFLELGWKSRLTKENPWGADVNVTGWAGKQRGVTYTLSVSRAF